MRSLHYGLAALLLFAAACNDLDGPNRRALAPTDQAAKDGAPECTVTSLADAGAGSLRAIVADANCYEIDVDQSVSGVIQLTSGEIEITHNVYIRGPGFLSGGDPSLITVSGENVHRVFEVDAGTNVGLAYMTISNGLAYDGEMLTPPSSGAGLLNYGNTTVTHTVFDNNTAVAGAAIANMVGATVTIDNSTLTNSVPSAVTEGTALYNAGTALVTSSTVSNSQGSGQGVIYNDAGHLTMQNSTVSGNTDRDGSVVNQSGSLALLYVTVTDNQGAPSANPNDGGLVSAGAGATLSMSNSIVAGNMEATGLAECSSSVPVTGAYNMLGSTSTCSFSSDANNITTDDPKLGVLANNGGAAMTQLPLTGSPAIDAIPLADCSAGADPTTWSMDQRGVHRPQGAGCDIGAVEAAAADNTPPPPAATVTASTVTVPEGGLNGVATNTGTYSTTAGTLVTASVGTVQTNADGTWSWTGPALAGPSTYTVDISVGTPLPDGQLPSGVAPAVSFTVNVTDVAPSVTIDARVVPGPDLITGYFSFTDPGEDSWTWTLDLGDGSPIQSGSAAQSGFSIPMPDHVYAPGNYTLKACVNDGSDVGCATKQFIVGDQTPPVITPVVTGTQGSNGWYTSNVSVSWQVIDNESAVTSAPCTTTTVSSDSPAHVVTCSATSGGGTSTHSVTIMRDASAPVITFSGATSYTVDQTLAITCSAVDPTSGVATQTCPSASGPAYAAGVGSHTLSATATNGAGLTSTSSVTYTVSATVASVSALVNLWVSNGGEANSLTVKLEHGDIGAFINEVDAQSGKKIPADKAAILIQLARQF